jgi:hypothetical protein
VYRTDGKYSADTGAPAWMLLMWDRGFHDFDRLAGVVQRDAHVLSRLPVVKRKMSHFNLKRSEHWHWPQPLKEFCEAIVFMSMHALCVLT